MRKITLITFIFGLLILTALAGCNDRGREANIGPEERPDRPATVNNANTVANVNVANNTADADNVKVADITGNANNYVGRNVTVSGWVERSYGTNSFRLDEDSVFTGGVDNDLLVVGAPGVIPAGLKFGNADARVRVTGTVQRVVIAEIERDFGFDLPPEVEAEFRDKPVLVARSVQAVEVEE